MIGLIAKGIVALLAIGGIGTAVAMTANDATGTQEAVITRVVDGDTIDVAIGSGTERIRLLNIDTPETVDPARPVECLGPEATAFLESLLPAHSRVTLEYDDERFDQHDRMLAGVFTADGRFVNAEVARAGFAAVQVVDGNDRFFPAVREAAREAQQEARGLYSPEVKCTLPGRVEDLAAAVAAAPSAADDAAAIPSVQLDAAVSELSTVINAANSLADLLTSAQTTVLLAAFEPADRQQFAARIESARSTAAQEQTAFLAAAGEARIREEEAARAEAARAEEARAREARDRARRAEEQASAARAAEAQRRAGAARDDDGGSAARERAPEPRSEPEARPPASSGGDGPYPGYTGPRCYAPGGGTWRPCPERG